MAARSREATAKPRSDAYVGLLLLALLAQMAGAVFLYLDYKAYPTNPPPKVQSAPVPAAPPAPVGQAPAAPAVPPAGQPPPMP